ncbi:MAG TPA: ribosome small subunit-dependent GTPase A [Clostridiales bacterium]|nr:ribosome small subunit-dependent GTPase A [Clostridiales bacterium]
MTRTGRILRGVGGQYLIADDAGPVGMASARGIFRKEGLVPTIGDLVECEPSGDPDTPWRMCKILPRRNYLVRPPIANLDGMVITLSAAEPPPDSYLADKLLTICLLNQIEPLICLTKTDLPQAIPDVTAGYRAAGCRTIETEPDDQASLNQLREWMRGRVITFAGQSGVGKSTLLNRLAGAEIALIGSLSGRVGRGKQTTRHVELYPLAGGYLADTPGFSSLELEDLGVSGEQLAAGYPEILAAAGQCRFTGCRHLGELGCAVPGCGMDPDRLQRYRYFRTRLDSLNPYSGSRPHTRS